MIMHTLSWKLAILIFFMSVVMATLVKSESMPVDYSGSNVLRRFIERLQQQRDAPDPPKSFPEQVEGVVHELFVSPDSPLEGNWTDSNQSLIGRLLNAESSASAVETDRNSNRIESEVPCAECLKKFRAKLIWRPSCTPKKISLPYCDGKCETYEVRTVTSQHASFLFVL